MTITAAAVRETPILFSGPMIRKILAGSKTQTRRPVVWDEKPLVPFFERAWVDPGGTSLFGPGPYLKVPCHHPEDPKGKGYERTVRVRCRYGYPGARLWVREAHRFVGHSHEYEEVEYKADGRRKCWKTDKIVAHDGKWRIFLPRWACRIRLEITQVRLQRLRKISVADILEEGVDCEKHDSGRCPSTCSTVRRTWSEGWDRLNEKRGYPWRSNPWCWVLTFTRRN